jgi:hypothetical protein
MVFICLMRLPLLDAFRTVDWKKEEERLRNLIREIEDIQINLF